MAVNLTICFGNNKENSSDEMYSNQIDGFERALFNQTATQLKHASREWSFQINNPVKLGDEELFCKDMNVITTLSKQVNTLTNEVLVLLKLDVNTVPETTPKFGTEALGRFKNAVFGHIVQILTEYDRLWSNG